MNSIQHGAHRIPEEVHILDVAIKHEPTVEELERELPMVYDGQIPVGDLLSRVMQAIYAELVELVETLPNMSDTARKRALADWVVKTKKQVVKLYAVVKWSRDADMVQKCMNITAFLMSQNQQFEGAVSGLKYARESLDPARLRNHDLLTSLDVLTTGSYLRLPTCIKKIIIPSPPLTDGQVAKTLSEMEDIIRYRIKLSEIIPIEMARYRIADGRIYFTVPKLFQTSLCLRGAEQDDGWFFVHVEFLINIGGDLTGSQEFPRIPEGIMKRHITDEADARLAFYLPLPDDVHLPNAEVTARRQLPTGVIDAPLVRVFNFLRMVLCSCSEVLTNLCHARNDVFILPAGDIVAERMRSLGWAEYLNVHMTQDRKTMTASYWIRSSPPNRQSQGRHRLKLPLLGGTLTISIVETPSKIQATPGPARSPRARILTKLYHKTKFGEARPSDEVEGLKFQVSWEATQGALGVNIPSEATTFSDGAIQVDADRLDFEFLLRNVIGRHTHAILIAFQIQLQQGVTRTIFGTPGAVRLTHDADVHALHVRLCEEEVVTITVDPRTGRLNLRDTGDLAATSRGPRFAMITERWNDNPTALQWALISLRLMTITDLAEQKAHYLGLQSFRQRNFANEEHAKLGSSARGTLYIQLQNFPNHYLVLVITDEQFRYALITTRVVSDSMFSHMVMEDIAWLDFDRIHGEGTTAPKRQPGKREPGRDDYSNTVSKETNSRFSLETQVLRELYSYCCARVAYMNVERQFKLRGIPFTHVDPGGIVSSELIHIQSSLARSVPALCVQSKHILSGAPAAEAAMENIRVTPLNWWSEEKAQVVTSVKLKYVQQPMGKTAGTSTVIRPSKRIIYDTSHAIVSFLSENVDTCVDEFLEEWARVSKMVVIARKVAQMSKETGWKDVHLLSFDLQTVEFAYAQDYTVSITCRDQLSPLGGNFDLRFSRSFLKEAVPGNDTCNPHDNAEPFLRNILRHGHGRLGDSLFRFIAMLRETLPIVTVLEEIRCKSQTVGKAVEVFAKAAGWYRLLFGDLRHALDFRLMNGQRVAILDASYSPFVASGSTTVAKPALPNDFENLGLQDIAQFSTTIASVVENVVSSGEVELGKVAIVDVGVVCDTPSVRVLALALYEGVVARGF